MASKKLNDFECSWVLMRATTLLDWQGKWYPLIHLSLREGTCEDESRFRARWHGAVSSWAWGSVTWWGSIPYLCSHTHTAYACPLGWQITALVVNLKVPVEVEAQLRSPAFATAEQSRQKSLASLHLCQFEVDSNQDLQERWKSPEAY